MAQPKPPKRHRHLFSILSLLLIFIFTTTVTGEEEEEEPSLSVAHTVRAVELGKSGTLECTHSVEGTPIFWFQGDDAAGKTPYPEDDTLRIYANNTEGTLTFNDVVFNDTGVYLCQSQDGNLTVTAELHVYVMPTYFREGMIIFGVNLALVVLFVVLAIYTFIQKQRAKAARKKKENPKKNAAPERQV
jgi:uncharacterized membrane protein